MSAHGRNHRYRYYTCHTRQRYGTDACDGDRLPAGELDTAALNGLLALYHNRDLFDRVSADAAARRQADRAQHERELKIVDTDIAKTEQAIDRYLLAFEAGTLPETRCGARVRELGAEIVDLQDRNTYYKPSSRKSGSNHAITSHPHTASLTPSKLDTVRAPETLVDLGLHNTNRHDTLDGPAIRVSPLQAKVDTHLSCRTAILDAIDRLHERTGTSEFARRDIVAEVQAAGGAAFERQTIYRCIRRLSGQEPGPAYRDLEQLDSDRLRLRR